MIDNLLTIAEEFVERDAARPKQASLRRAASTAYYAVFHSLAKLCADQFVGYSKPWDVYTPVYRALDHAAARKAFERVRKGPAAGAAFAKIGLAFVNLQDARVEADYVPESFKYSRSEVKDLIVEARSAISAIDALSAESKLQLAVLFLTKPR